MKIAAETKPTSSIAAASTAERRSITSARPVRRSWAIGATTLNEYRKYIEKDAALERRFQPFTVGEPSQEATLEILKGLREKYE